MHANVGRALALISKRVIGCHPAGPHPAIQHQPLLERAAPPDEFGGIIGKLHMHPPVAGRPNEFESRP